MSTKNNLVNDFPNKPIDHSKNLWQQNLVGAIGIYGFNSTKIIFTDGLNVTIVIIDQAPHYVPTFSYKTSRAVCPNTFLYLTTL